MTHTAAGRSAGREIHRPLGPCTLVFGPQGIRIDMVGEVRAQFTEIDACRLRDLLCLELGPPSADVLRRGGSDAK